MVSGFDLGTILAREPNGFDNQSGFLKACSQDPCLSRIKLIAEPWDCGPGGYQVGASLPAGQSGMTIPRYDAQVLDRRCPRSRIDRGAVWICLHIQPSGKQPLGIHQLCHRP